MVSLRFLFFLRMKIIAQAWQITRVINNIEELEYPKISSFVLSTELNIWIVGKSAPQRYSYVGANVLEILVVNS